MTIRGNIALPILAGGVLPAGPSDGDVAQFVRGCSVVAHNPAVPDGIVYWEVTLDIPRFPDLAIITGSCGGASGGFTPPYIFNWHCPSVGVYLLTAWTPDSEDGWETTLDVAINFKIAGLPNR